MIRIDGPMLACSRTGGAKTCGDGVSGGGDLVALDGVACSPNDEKALGERKD